MFEIKDLWVTQQMFRNPAKILGMMKFAQNGGRFDKKPLVYKMDNGLHYLGDGHHRMSAYYLAGINEYDEDLVEFFPFQTSKFQEINHEVGWVTPHNIETHVRLKDLTDWKNTIKSFRKSGMTEKEINAHIRVSSEFYCTPRNGINTIVDFLNAQGKD